MLFHRLKFSGLLSFGPEGIDLPMEPLTVLIGPNGSGKSNLLEAISLFQAAPRGISEPISGMGGVREWLWKGLEAPDSIALEAMVDYPPTRTLRHSLTLSDQGGRPLVADEQIEPSKKHSGDPSGYRYYRPPPLTLADQGGRLLVADEQIEPSEKHSGDPSGYRYYRPPQWDEREMLKEAKAKSPQSSKSRNVNVHTPTMFIDQNRGVVEFFRTFEQENSLLYSFAMMDYPALWYLKHQYEQIRLYRSWSFGPHAKLRQPCNAHARSDFLDEGGENLPLVLSQLHGAHKKSFLSALSKLFDGIVDIQCPVTGGTVALFLEESGNRSIPATRLSDGTLRYLCLLAILLHPEPPPLICIEDPELGLHPDLLPTLSDLMREASERTQLIVTTHSDVLVDTLTDQPESVVVCEKHDGQTEMRRLDKDDLAKWLNDYRLGDLWTSGELGGNRW